MAPPNALRIEWSLSLILENILVTLPDFFYQRCELDSVHLTSKIIFVYFSSEIQIFVEIRGI